jgi:hypothetical protein
MSLSGYMAVWCAAWAGGADQGGLVSYLRAFVREVLRVRLNTIVGLDDWEANDADGNIAEVVDWSILKTMWSSLKVHNCSPACFQPCAARLTPPLHSFAPFTAGYLGLCLSLSLSVSLLCFSFPSPGVYP